MKKIIAMVLCFTFVFANIAFAADEVLTNEVTPLKFSIAEAIAYAKEHNYEILLAQIDEKNMKTSKNSAKDAESAAKDWYKENKNNDNFSSYKTRAGYNTQSVKNQEKMLILKNTQKGLSLEVSVETAYYNLSEKKMAYDFKKNTCEQINNNLEISQKKLAIGDISELNYKKVELEKGTSDISLMSAESDYKKAMMDFNQVLGLPLMQEVRLTDEITGFAYNVPTFDEKLDELKLIDSTYVQNMLDAELFESEKRLTKTYYGGSSDQYKQLLLSEQQNQINDKHYYETMEYNLIFDIINLNIAARNITLDKQLIDISKLTLDVAKQKYAAGLISEMDMISAELDYQNAKLKYVQELHSYKTQVLKFDKNVD
ncbi:MAG TPA: hypothetical protein DEG71_01870 [Clostridiales bacterium]|nr:hypothetical protein [Clostridiales bacterium]